MIELDNGVTFNAVLQDLQFHPVTDRILHVDFYQLFEDKEIALNIPVNLVGNSRGVKNGGVLRRNNRKLRIKALPANLPDFIEIDITPLKIGDKVAVGDLPKEGYTFYIQTIQWFAKLKQQELPLLKTTMMKKKLKVKKEQKQQLQKRRLKNKFINNDCKKHFLNEGAFLL